MVGAGGFEPPNTGSKVPRLAAWPRPIINVGESESPLLPNTPHRVPKRCTWFRSRLTCSAPSLEEPYGRAREGPDGPAVPRGSLDAAADLPGMVQRARDAEHRRSASGHQRAQRPGSQQVRLHAIDLRVRRRDGGLEAIVKA